MVEKSRILADLSADQRHALLERLREKKLAQRGPGIRPRPVGLHPLPLAFAQERLWFLDQLEKGSAAYNLLFGVRLTGRLDRRALRRTLAELVRRHESLRTTFGQREGRPFQAVAPPAAPPLPWIDLSGVPASAGEAELLRVLRDEAAYPYDLECGPLLRCKLLRFRPDDHALAVAMHHIISDGWSMAVFLREMSDLYTAFAAGRPSPLPEPEIQYADFAVWQREHLSGATLETELAWWRERLAGLPVLELPTDRPRPARQSQRGAEARLTLDAAVAGRVHELGHREGATPFMVLLAVWKALLFRSTGQIDFAVGSPVANREHAEVAGLIGFFVNTLVLRTDLAGGPGFRELLGRVRRTSIAAYDHTALPFEKLVEHLQPERSGGNPLFQVLCHMQNQPWPELRIGDVRLAILDLGTQVAKLDLSLGWREEDGRLEGRLEYATDLYETASVERMLHCYGTLLDGALDDLERDVTELPLLDEAERQQLLREATGPAHARHAGQDRIEGRCIHHRIEEHAARTPEAPAVEGLTYRELNERANRLAWWLRAQGIGLEARVGVLFERSPEMVVAALGVLKAGAAYVPLDPSYPAERLAFLATDSQARLGSTDRPVIVTREGLAGLLPEDLARRARIVRLDADAANAADTAELARQPPGNPPPRATPGNLAYVVYTSGSTGQPKGAAVPHAALSRLVDWYAQAFGATPADRASWIASPAFDPAVREVWSCLACGAWLRIPDEGVRSEPARLAAWLADEGITLTYMPAPLAQAALPGPWPEDLRLRVFTVGGDRLVRRPPAGAPFQVYNLYGPAECTVNATCGRVEPHGTDLPSLGAPIAGARVYVVDPWGGLTPAGVPGEIWIGGWGVGRGYLDRPSWTAERFVPDAFGTAGDTAGERLYRTGDLGRRRPGGPLEFLGRIDHQVKVRGVRIELGEVEAALHAHPGVAACAVLVRDTSLVAYLVPADGAGPNSADLRRHLARRLPAAMVPAAFVVLDALPLNPNGKVDRRALARLEPPAGEAHAAAGAHVPPRTATEEILAAVWADLLGVERVGAHDDFFALGGHSLLGIQVLSRLRTLFGVELPVRALFEEPALAGFAARMDAVLAGLHESAVPAAAPLERVAREGRLPLSFAQERLWFLERLEPGTAFYNVPSATRFRGPLEVDVLRRGFAELVWRHEALRTTFDEENGRPFQVIAPAVAAEMPLIDLSALPGPLFDAELLRQATAEARRPFDLRRGPLVRTSLFRLAPQDHVLVSTLHHIVSDGWSMTVLIREMAALYEAFCDGRPSPLPELPVQYADYALWQRGWLQGAVLAAEIEWWRARLAGVPALQLPTDRPRLPVETFRGRQRPAGISAEMTGALHELSRREGVTLFMTLLAAFQTMLLRYSGQTDLAVGSPIANRNRSETEGVIGFFVNTLVLRTDLSCDPTFRKLLARVREVALGAYAHENLPFEKIVLELQPERDTSRNPLFQVMCVLQNQPWKAVRLRDLEISGLSLDTATAKLDLTLSWSTAGDALGALLEHNTDLFDDATAWRMYACCVAVLRAGVEDPDCRLGALPLLGEAERRQLLAEAAGPPCAWDGRCVHYRMEEQAARFPEAPAVDGLTYGELNARANRLAWWLRAQGAGPEMRVAVLLERSPAMVVAWLGVLKAGAAYVPLDPFYPADRLAWFLADSQAGVARPLVVTREGLAGLLPALQELPEDTVGRACILRLDADADELTRYGPGNPPALAMPENLAYVIYTSGSTGRPKGVAVAHSTVSRMADWHREAFGVTPADVATQVTSPAFDPAVWEIWSCLCCGASLRVPDDDVRAAPARLIAWMADQGITFGYMPTPLAEAAFAVQPWPAHLRLRVFVLGGDRLHRRPAADVPFAVYSLYGVTEGTVNSAGGRVAPHGRELPSIGRPIAGVRIHLLDSRGELVPAGVPGEVWIGGGLARGYLGRPDWTAERFLPDPFSGEPGERLYRTGDLARQRPGGDLDFLGRIDHQVKVRGLRIEPGEVEAALLEHPGIGACAVLAQGTQGLVAYMVPSGEVIPTSAELRSFLAAKLPSPVVPSAFVTLDALPLSPVGKLDRRALAALAPPVEASVGAHLPPRTATEEIVAAVWADLLDVERVGVDDNFFALGGHSLLGIQMLSRVRTLLRVELPVRALFEEPALAGFAARVDSVLAASAASAASREGAAAPPPPLQRIDRHGDREGGGRLPLSFAQERLWFLEQLEPGTAFYNIPSATRFNGPLRVGVLRRGFAEIVRRHESLRTTFGAAHGQPFQVIAPDVALQTPEMPMIDLSALDGRARDAELLRLATDEVRRPFDLQRGPLVRAPLFRLAAYDHVLVSTLHHIISDGWSTTVLIREMAALYEAFSAGRPSPLPELPIQYADYAVWQRSHLQGEALAAEVAWWRRRLAGLTSLQLPADRPRPPVETFRGRRRPAGLSGGLTGALHELGRGEGVTLFMTLLAAFQTMLLRYSGQTDLAVGSPIANRNRSETEEVIGFFANTLVLRTDLSGDPTFRELLARVREVTLGAYAHENLPFEKIVLELQPERDMSRNPLFQVMCVLQNQPWKAAPLRDLEISGLSLDTATAKFDLTLFWQETGGVLGALLEHNTDLFNDATAWRMYEHCVAILRAGAEDPDRRVGALPLLAEAERHQLLREWSEPTGSTEWKGRCVHHQVEEQAARTPGRVAVIDGERSLTYAGLDARANRLAHGLRRRGVGPESLVGICVERSLEMLVAALAVAKAGGALVALDPAYPRERLATIIDDAGLAVLLTQEELLTSFPEHEHIALLYERGADLFPEESESTPERGVDLDNPIYAIYTSGSTGQPKGIVVTHRAFSSLIDWQLRAADLRPGAKTVALSTFGFCVSFQEMFSCWCSGGTLVVADEMTRRDVGGLGAFLEEHGIERLHLPFAALKHLAEAADRERLPAGLREVITAGEQLQVTPAVRSLFERLPGCVLSNQYGASETHVISALTLTGEPAAWPAIPPVGRPVDRVRIHLLAPGLQPVPVGVAGELYAGGVCLPRCYLNDPVLTAQKLVPDPYGAEPGARLYRTGDAARYLSGGRIVYHGRIDTQVKVRGFRIELGEVETVLARHPRVRDAAVVAKAAKADGHRLVAYVVAHSESADFGEIRAYLKQKLPEFMVPAAFVEVLALPLNANGKLDLTALPEPGVQAARAYVAPRTEIEQLLVKIYADLLKIERVGIHDNFFELGGHSLLGTRLMAQIRETVGIDLRVRMLFELPTVAEMGEAVAQALMEETDDEALAAVLAELEREEMSAEVLEGAA